jgi:anti-sigma-K factor RskA
MSPDLESRLRAALRPVAPSDELEKNLIARVTDEPRYARPKHHRFGWAGSKSRARWLAAAAAASLLVAVGIQNRGQQRERESGLEARRQVVEALRMTSQKLNLAYETVKSQSTSLADENPGA